MNVIEISNLKKSYGKSRGIVDISFNVEQGEIYGFIGPNGAGKSTTIRTLLALLKPDSGNAKIFGKDCIKDAPIISKDVGYLPSEANFFEYMKVKELFEYTASLYSKDCKERTKILCDRLNLETNRKIADLSLGNKRKVGIICALLHSPKLLILDEPTSSLDPLVQQVFFDILTEENKSGVTIFFSSHVLSEVQKICTKVAVVKEGKIIDIQNISDLRKKGYKRINLVLDNGFDKSILENLQIKNFEQKNNTLSFMFMGDVMELIQTLSRFKLSDVYIEEPTLEEIFMHYYS